ncbi:MAG: hypothetical protein F7B11_01340 [Caldisphaeraceae archaeon]|nr:hypothetical protein [Caldisphaeraceae archaeon]
MEEKEIEKNILFLLSEHESLTFEEIKAKMGWEGDLRPLRKALSHLIREDLVERVPDYERKRMTFRKRG